VWVVRSSISVIRRREQEEERESPSSLAEVVGVEGWQEGGDQSICSAGHDDL
jgi:hypothetical protein